MIDSHTKMTHLEAIIILILMSFSSLHASFAEHLWGPKYITTLEIQCVALSFSIDVHSATPAFLNS